MRLPSAGVGRHTLANLKFRLQKKTGADDQHRRLPLRWIKERLS
jgi:hypothetical protein